MLRVILWILLGYFLYKFVFGFLLPLFRVSRQMKRQVRNFQHHMHEAQNQQYKQQPYQQSATAQQQPATSPSEKSGDYIDFEEIK